MAIKRMDFYETWFGMTKKVAFRTILVVGIIVISVAYTVKCTYFP